MPGFLCGVCLGRASFLRPGRPCVGGVWSQRGIGFECNNVIALRPRFNPSHCPRADHILQLGARPKGTSPGAKSPPVGDATNATTPTAAGMAQQEVLYPYAGGSGHGNRTLDLLAEARNRGAAVGAFTVYSLEGIRAVVQAAEATGRSAILQVQSAPVVLRHR